MIVPAFPAFNIYSRIARRTTALGPLCIATVVSQLPGWAVEVIDENNYRKYGPRDPAGLPDHETLQSIRRADVVGFYGGLSSTIPRLFHLVQRYKAHGAVTIAGGQHFVGENIRDALENGLDFIVIGEGERTIHDLIGAIRLGTDPAEIAGIAFLRNGHLVQTPERPPIVRFDDLPLPDFKLLRYAKVKIYPVSWSRGCGMNCEFCTVKGKPRAASPERVVEQIASVLEAHGGRHFFVVDDQFGHNRAAALTLCRLLASYQKAVSTRLDITVQIRLDCARDGELLIAMRNAGINTVAIGFESPIPEELKAMDKRTNPEDMVALTRLYHKAGIRVHGMFIFGYPLPSGSIMNMSAPQRIQHFRQFIRNSKLETIQVLLPVPLPGTELTARLDAAGRIFPRDHIGWEYYDGNFPLFEPDPPLTPEDMQVALRRINGRFYRFSYMFAIARNVLIFPAMIFSLWNLRYGWRKWHHIWQNSLVRFGGWLLYRRWKDQIRRDPFSRKLEQVQQTIRTSGETTGNPE